MLNEVFVGARAAGSYSCTGICMKQNEFANYATAVLFATLIANICS